MDLDALDTAYGAEQIDTDLLETDIRSRLEYALRNETYCGRDPFGKKRYGADAGNMCYVFGKEYNILKLVINITFTFFTGSFYKNGTMKLKFKSSAKRLIDRLNIFVGMNRGWLPTDYGTKPYDALSEAEKETIDSFQSREEYEEVVANPDKYIVKDFDIDTLLDAKEV